MRILFVWLTCVAIMFTVTVGWYISQELVVQIAHQCLSDVTGQGLALLTLIEYANIIWGPLFDILILLWAIVSSQATDPVSRYR